jgi:hypothetical protein
VINLINCRRVCTNTCCSSARCLAPWNNSNPTIWLHLWAALQCFVDYEPQNPRVITGFVRIRWWWKLHPLNITQNYIYQWGYFRNHKPIIRGLKLFSQGSSLSHAVQTAFVFVRIHNIFKHLPTILTFSVPCCLFNIWDMWPTPTQCITDLF